MINQDDPRIAKLLSEWHEAERPDYESRYGSPDFDVSEKKTLRQRDKYILLDVGEGWRYGGHGRAGAFMIDRQTGDIWKIKAYGVPHEENWIGFLGEVCGKELYKNRWRFASKGTRKPAGALPEAQVY